MAGFVAQGGFFGIDQFAPARRIFLGKEFAHWNFAESGVAVKSGPVLEGEFLRLEEQVPILQKAIEKSLSNVCQKFLAWI